MGIIQGLQANIFTTTNDVQKNIDTLNNSITELNSKLSTEKKINSNLKKGYSNIDSEENGTSIMILDSKIMYNTNYLTNCTLILGILIIFYIINKIFSK